MINIVRGPENPTDRKYLLRGAICPNCGTRFTYTEEDVQTDQQAHESWVHCPMCKYCLDTFRSYAWVDPKDL